MGHIARYVSALQCLQAYPRHSWGVSRPYLLRIFSVQRYLRVEKIRSNYGSGISLVGQR